MKEPRALSYAPDRGGWMLGLSSRPLVVATALALLLVGGGLPAYAAADDPKPVAPADTLDSASDQAALSRQIISYYFHTTKRCVSCRKIEAYGREAIEAGFPEQLRRGEIVWLPVNIDEKDNEHFVEDYQLFTKSIILVERNDTTQVRWKNLSRVWELLNDKSRFVQYVQEETRAYMESPN